MKSPLCATVCRLLPSLVLPLTLLPSMVAARELLDARDPKALAGVIRELGYRAELTTDEVGDPMIKSSVGDTRFGIVFYGCDRERHDECDFLLFKVGYDLLEEIGLEAINRWNASQLVGRAYRDEANDPWLEMAWNLEGGVSAANFQSTLEWWKLSVDQFEDHIGF